jgi:hypothetical protein
MRNPLFDIVDRNKASTPSYSGGAKLQRVPLSRETGEG